MNLGSTQSVVEDTAPRDTLLPRLLSGELPVPEGAIKEGGHA